MKTLTLVITLVFSCLVFSQVPYGQNPDWTSTDITNVSTGGAFADINQDGWVDFVVANGNDMARQKVVVYYNTGTGSFPASPQWQSADIDYHGHLDVGDVNGDGYPDVAVCVYIGASGFSSPGKVKLYMNNAGTLSSSPTWSSADQFYTFGCAFGDADLDGDLDLAVATGESYYSNPDQPRIYFNNGGELETLPSWKGTAAQYSYDVEWADFDKDGDLDLVFAGESNSNKIFRNNNGVIETTPYWQSTDPSQYANSLYTGDVNKDGWIDLAISDNNQLGGTGKFKIYLNNNGTMSTTPFWSSAFSGYGSGIMLADIDNDLDKDLITGGWWQPCRIYLNNNGTFNTNPEYTSTSSSVVEAIVCADIDKDAVQDIEELFTGNGTKKLFYLSRTPLQKITRVVIGIDTLSNTEYCYDLEGGWVSLNTPPAAGTAISVEAAISLDLELGITNWDNNKGNYLFLNTNQHTPFQISVNIEGGWNMVSIPGLHPVSQHVDTWWQYRDMSTQVFRGWGAAYQHINIAAPGYGYWLKHPGSRIYNTGDEWPAGGILSYPHYPIPCPAGWTMFGPYEQTVNALGLTTTPPGLITGTIYKYVAGTGYQAASQLVPGNGYWVKLTAAGNINIPSGEEKKISSGEGIPGSFGRIIVTDREGKSFTLYAADKSTDLSKYDLPPYPPQGMFDVRYSTQRYAENIRTPQSIEMSGVEYPVKLKAENKGIIISDASGNQITKLKAGEEYTVEAAGMLYVCSDETPLSYSLEQNYPNPFNPSTTISFSLPEDAANVKLIIYNSLGEKIAELVNKELSAGTYNYKWDSGKNATGIYIYQLTADKFIASGKMLLLR